MYQYSLLFQDSSVHIYSELLILEEQSVFSACSWRSSTFWLMQHLDWLWEHLNWSQFKLSVGIKANKWGEDESTPSSLHPSICGFLMRLWGGFPGHVTATWWHFHTVCTSQSEKLQSPARTPVSFHVLSHSAHIAHSCCDFHDLLMLSPKYFCALYCFEV